MSGNDKGTEGKSNELLYLPPPSVLTRPDMTEYLVPVERPSAKIIRKCKENPFVPIGATLTVAALCYGVISMVRNDGRMSQIMMRCRVGAQGFTVSALLIGAMYQANKKEK